MTKRKQYIKPKAINLSGFGAVGQAPLGTCEGGTQPTVGYCQNGPGVGQPGSFCSPTGTNPTAGVCNNGGNVENNCAWGSIFS